MGRGVSKSAAGTSLSVQLDEQGPLQPLAAVRTIHSLALDLTKLHESGQLHRQITAATVTMSVDGHLKLAAADPKAVRLSKVDMISPEWPAELQADIPRNLREAE